MHKNPIQIDRKPQHMHKNIGQIDSRPVYMQNLVKSFGIETNIFHKYDKILKGNP